MPAPVGFDDLVGQHHPHQPRAGGQLRGGRAGAATGQAPYHLVVELRFPSEEAMQGSINAEEGQAMARDLQAFASGGVTILFCRTASA